MFVGDAATNAQIPGRRPVADVAALIGICGGEPHLRVWLADSFPPGIHAAEMTVGSETFPVDIEVEAKARVSIVPSTLSLSGAPGEEASTTFTIEKCRQHADRAP